MNHSKAENLVVSSDGGGGGGGEPNEASACLNNSSKQQVPLTLADKVRLSLIVFLNVIQQLYSFRLLFYF